MEQRLARTYVEMWSTADRHNAGWRMECAVVVAWALQPRDEIPPFDRQTTQPAFLEDLVDPTLRAASRARSQLRSRAELEAFRVDAERWWQRARRARPAYDRLTKPTSTLSNKKRALVRNAICARQGDRLAARRRAVGRRGARGVRRLAI